MAGCYPLQAGSGIALAGALAGLGYVIGTVLSYVPGVSSTTRSMGASMRDYALVALIFASASGGIASLLNEVIAASIPGSPADCNLLKDFYYISTVKSTIILGAIGAIAAALPLIPVVGVALSLAWSVVMAPAVIVLGAIILPVSIFQWVLLEVFTIAGPFMFPAAVAAIAAPNRILKGLGGVLLAFSTVFYAALPLIPWAMGAVLNTDNPTALIEELANRASTWNAVSGIFELVNIPGFYMDLGKWVMITFVGMILIAIALAAARGLSQSLGGVSASV